MPQPEVVINIQGGVVQEVYASGELADLTIVDWDVPSGDEGVTETVHHGEPLRANVVHPIILPWGRLTGSETQAVTDAAGQREAGDPLT